MKPNYSCWIRAFRQLCSAWIDSHCSMKYCRLKLEENHSLMSKYFTGIIHFVKRERQLTKNVKRTDWDKKRKKMQKRFICTFDACCVVTGCLISAYSCCMIFQSSSNLWMCSTLMKNNVCVLDLDQTWLCYGPRPFRCRMRSAIDETEIKRFTPCTHTTVMLLMWRVPFLLTYGPTCTC